MEHKLIQGGEQYLPFARSRIKALRATGLKYASQKFGIDGVSVKVRIAGEHEYIELEGGGSYASVFSGVQYPETGLVSSSATGVKGAKFLTGTFPETVVEPGWFQKVGKTRFGTSPYSKNFLRMSQIVTKQAGSFPAGITGRYGVILGGALQIKIYADGFEKIKLELESPYTGQFTVGPFYGPNPLDQYIAYEKTGKSWSTSTVSFTPSISSGKKPIIAGIVVSTQDEQFSEYVGYGPDSSDTYLSKGTGGISSTGSSLVRIFRHIGTENEIEVFDVAPLPYMRETSVSTESVTAEGPLFIGYEESKKFSVLNDVETSLPFRRWHATERVATNPADEIFVLRETNSLLKVDSYFNDGSLSNDYDNNPYQITRGFSLSFVPAGSTATHNNVVAGSLGQYGYIDGIIPGADGTKVYIYYGLHDDSESLGPLPHEAFYTFLPTKFTEYLDIINIAVIDGVYSFSKTQTINLGATTLRSDDWWADFSVPEKRSDHFESKLHGATLEVNGFIWSDRFCYSVVENEFYAIPEFQEYPPVFQYPGSKSLNAKDHVTGPEDDRTSYISVVPGGTTATYVMLKTATVKTYKLKKDSTTETRYIEETMSGSSGGGGFSWGEDPLAHAMRFSPAPQKRQR